MPEKAHILHYRILGKGDPVVFLHGFLESLSMWEVLQLEKMPFQSILIDLPGHGNSKELPEEVSIKAMAENVSRTLEDIGISSFGLVGHSMGGYVALEVARDNPSVHSVFLMNSSFWEDSEQKKKDRNRVIGVVEKNKLTFLGEAIPALFLHPEEHKRFVDALIAEAKGMEAAAIIYATVAMRDRRSNEEVCVGLKDRLKIVQGEQDKSIPLTDMLTNTAGKGMDVTILPEVAHMSHVEANGVIRSMLVEMFEDMPRKIQS